MAIRNNFTAGEVLVAQDLNDTFASKLDLAGKKVLQIVGNTDTSTRTTTSTSFVDGNLSATITPQKSDSAVILIANLYVSASASTDNTTGVIQITDSSNTAVQGAQFSVFGTENITGTGSRFSYATMTIIGYSTPGIASAVTYKVRFRSGVNTTTTSIRGADQTSDLYAIEVSA